MTSPQPPPNYELLQSRVSRRSQIINSVRSPLGFFALALLIVEAFLIGASILLSPDLRVVAFFLGVVLFLLVFGVVVWLVVKHPTNLIFGERTQLEFQAMQIYGRREAPLTDLELLSLEVVEAPQAVTGQLPAGESEPGE